MRNQAHRHQQRERRGGFQQGADINGQRRIHGKQQPGLGEGLPVLLKKAPQPVSIAGAEHAQNMVRAAKAADGMHVIQNATNGSQAQRNAVIKRNSRIGQDARRGCGKPRRQHLSQLRRLWSGEFF